MYLHIGCNIIVPIKSIIGIFNIDSTLSSSDSYKFIKESDDDGFVSNISKNINKDEIKSLIVSEIDKKSKIFLSPISSSTLIKRILEDKINILK